MKSLLGIAALSLACAAFGQGTPAAILSYTTSAGAFVDGTVGWTFQTIRTLSVTQLGCFSKVFDDNPGVTSIQVGLWNGSGSLLASNSITPNSLLFDRTRYESTPPVPLSPGQVYHLGIYYPDGVLGLDVAGPLAAGSVSVSPEIQLGEAASSASGFSDPVEIAGTAGTIYAGPNFRFQSQPTVAILLWPSNQVRLSWSIAFPGYTIQTKPGLFGTWANAGLSATVVTNEFVAFDAVGSAPKYYRLIK